MSAIPAGYPALTFLDRLQRAGVGRIMVGRSGALPTIKSLSNVVSEAEDTPADLPVVPVTFSLDCGGDDDARASDRTIHSGHFMVSHVHDESPEEDVKDDDADDESDSELVDSERNRITVDDMTALPDALSPYRTAPVYDQRAQTGLGRVAAHIDTSLTKLFECMTLAYSGKLKTPKWKNFKKKGLHVGLKDKIRLNNLIWREWHMQYKQGRDPIGCQFVTPLPDKSSAITEAEIFKWRQQLITVISEYQTWRPQLCKRLEEGEGGASLLRAKRISQERHGRLTSLSRLEDQGFYSGSSTTNDMNLLEPNEYLMDMSDTLFSSTSMLNGRDLCFEGWVAEIMQPDLDSLQPYLEEELMDTFDPQSLRFGRYSGQTADMFPQMNWTGTSNVSVPQSSTTLTAPLTQQSLGEMSALSYQSQPQVAFEVGAVSDIFGGKNGEDMFADNTSLVMFGGETSPSMLLAGPGLGQLQPLIGSTFEQTAAKSSFDSGLYRHVGIGFAAANTGSATQGFPVSERAISDSGFVVPLCSAASNQQNKQPASTARLSFGSSEEIRAMLQSQYMRNLKIENHVSSPLSQESKPSAAATKDVSALAYSNEVLDQLYSLLSTSCFSAEPSAEGVVVMETSNTGTAVSQQSDMLVSAGDVSGQTAVGIECQPTLAASIQPAVGASAQVHKVSADTGKEARSLDNLISLDLDSDAVSRRFSTGSLGGHAPSVFRTPQLIAPSPSPNVLHQPTEPVPVLKRSSATIMQRLSSAQQHDSSLHLRKTVSLLTGQQQPSVHFADTPSSTPAKPSFSSSGQTSRSASSLQSHSNTEHTGQHRRRGSVLEQLLTQAPLSDMAHVVPQRQLRAVSDHSLSAQVHQMSDKKRRTRHKSDQMQRPSSGAPKTSPSSVSTAPKTSPSSLSAAPKTPPQATATATDVMNRTSAVFQPINPLMPVHPNRAMKVVSPVQQNLLSPAVTQKMPSSVMTGLTVGTELPSRAVESPSIAQSTIRSPPSDPTDLQIHQQQVRSRHASSDSTYLRRDDVSLFPTARGGTPTQQELSREHRRVSHITSEQRRRCSIKSGFDTLNRLVPGLRENTSNKISKATTLHKTAEYCKKLKSEREAMRAEIENLNSQIRLLDTDISMCQSMLPASGITPGMSQRHTQHSRDQLKKYIADRTVANWKFWMFGFIIQPLFESFESSVTTTTLSEFQHSLLNWIEEHCSLVVLRPAVFSSLRELGLRTSVLCNPAQLPREAEQAAAAYLASLR